MAKVYNEVTSIFNDKTGKWETVSEDSFDYDGPMDLCGGGGLFGGRHWNPGWGSMKSETKGVLNPKMSAITPAMNELVEDEATGLPVLQSSKDELDEAKRLRDESIEGITTGGAKEDYFKKLYKSGVAGHGRLAHTLKQSGEDFKRDVEGSLLDFDKEKQRVEKQAIGQLDTIKDTVHDTRDYYDEVYTERGRGLGRFGGGYRFAEGGGHEGKTLFNTNLGTKTKPMEVVEDMYQYPYATGPLPQVPDAQKDEEESPI